ncbi:MAG: hypothetical protein MUF06_01200 [Pirellulaceae bacterium]|jgi:hypothetical protein|nr:hypothetical protein [Pirellulaceae bacterium]
MALHESDREDLLREATALVPRAEYRLSHEPEPVTIGFRRDGALSLFLGPDSVYQFTAAGELRRAFVAGLLYKAEKGKLIELRRERSDAGVHLVRRTLDAPEQHHWLTVAACRCDAVVGALARGEMELVGQVPFDGNVAARVVQWREEHPGPIVVAQRPHAS